MCMCNPMIKTPFCGKGDCVWPGQKKKGDNINEFPVIVIDDSNIEKFQELCKIASEKGYKLSSSSCGCIHDSGDNCCLTLQAIFVKDGSKKLFDREYAILWVGKNLSPDEVFERDKLDKWASQNGWGPSEL